MAVPNAQDVMQALFDLMANQVVRLTVEGEIGNVDARLEVREGREWRTRGIAVAEETAEEAIAEALRGDPDA